MAFAFFNSITNQSAGRDYLSLAGPGFRDFSRIAASDPSIWRDILLANREEVLKQTDRFRQSLQAFETALTGGDERALEEMIRSASDGRAGWQMGSGRSGGPK